MLGGCGSGGDEDVPAPPANAVPVVVAAGTVDADRLTTVAFSSAGSSDPEGAAITYAWTFGDNATSTEANPTHVYARGGTYTAQLTVQDDKGATTSRSVTVTIAADASATIVGTSAVKAELPGKVTVDVDGGTFAAPTTIGLWTTTREETKRDWDASAVMFASPVRATAEIRVNVGAATPTKAVHISATLPAAVITSLGSDAEPVAFVQIYQNGGDETLDNFEFVTSTYDVASKTLKFDLPVEAFTDLRSKTGGVEAVVVLGSTKTAPAQTAAIRPFSIRTSTGEAELPGPSPADAILGPVRQDFASALAAGCGGTTLAAPITGAAVTGAFDGKRHFGTDYRAATGTPVMAMAAGTVTRIGFDSRPLLKPDPRSGKLVKGWGHYIVITTADDSVILYAHLQDGQIKVIQGQIVQTGAVIALSNDSGGSSAPHLHVEYAPFGKTYQNKGAKVDPQACVGANVSGSVAISDNGTLADDAFAVSINGKEFCRTTIGQPNSCVIGALRSGTTATLSITVLVAPDNVGTFQLTLSNGLTFSDGTRTRTGRPGLGESLSFAIKAS